MLDYLVREGNPPGTGNEPHQITFDLFRGVGVAEIQPMRHPKHMSVHDNPFGFSKDHTQDDVRGLARHSRQLDQFFHCVRNPSPKLLHEHLTGALDVLGLVSVETRRPNFFFQDVTRSLQIVFRGSILLKQLPRHPEFHQLAQDLQVARPWHWPKQ